MAGDASSPSPTSIPLVSGDTVQHVSVGKTATFEIVVPGFTKDAVDIHLVGPSKRPCPFRLVETEGDSFNLEFTCTEVGSYISDVAVNGRRLTDGPLIAKVYNSSLIHVSNVSSGIVGRPCQFRVDASQAGEGQLEISINEGELPNHVQVLGGGRCLVAFTPETPKPHAIDIHFNGETVPGCPFEVRVGDPSHVSVDLRSLELIPIGHTAGFHISVDSVSSAELAVSVRGPSTDLPVKVSGNVRSGFVAEFVPREVGAHSVLIEANGASVAGTPFVSKAYDTKRVIVGAVPKGAVRRPLQFTVDASEAGEGNLEITITARGHNVATQVHPQGSARFIVGFVPLEVVDHTISVNFNKEAVPGSPFIAEVQGDPHHIDVSGQGLTAAAVGKPANFVVSNVVGSIEDLEVNVEGPGGCSVPAQVNDAGEKTFRVEFCPRLAGEHRIHVNLNSSPAGGSPFLCRVYDVSAIKVKPTQQGVLGRPVTFMVETMDAGPGNLEVTVNDGQVATSAQAQGPHIYAISFTPKEAGLHVLQLRFNGEAVPGSPFSCDVSEAARVSVSGDVDKVSVGRPATIVVTITAPQTSDISQGLQVSVTSPTRNKIQTSVHEENTGRYIAEFTPTEVGDHSVLVHLDEETVAGSPFIVKSYDASKVKVTDVSHGVAGRPLFFSIDAAMAGAGNLEIIVSVAGRNVPNFVQAEGNARFKVNFKPQDAANHQLSVRFNGEPVPGSPFTCKVRTVGQVALGGPAFKMAALRKPAILTVDPRGADISECILSIVSPSGKNVPVVLSGSAQFKFLGEFVPAEVGPHLVTVLLDGDPVDESPFTCNVYDVSKVTITGLGSAKVGSPVTFTVDASEAGEGTLELVVTSGKVSVRAEVAARSRGLYDVTFIPHVAATHFVAISFNDEDVPASPFPCSVAGNDKQIDSSGVYASGEGLKKVQVGCPTSFLVDTHGAPGDMDVRVQGPQGEVPVRVHTLPSGLFRVEYTAQKVGLHHVTVDVVGNKPQSFHVDGYDSSCVSIQAPQESTVGREVVVKVNTEGAGEGEITASVRTLGQTVAYALRSSPRDKHQHELLFTPQLPVTHKMDFRFNGVPVPGTPISLQTLDRTESVGDGVLAKGAGLHACRVGRPASFIIYTNGTATQEVDVVVSGPRGEVVPVRCYQQKDGNLLAQFQATVAGTHKVEVTVGGREVKSSPFFCQAQDPSCVHIEEIKNTSVAVGENIVFRVNREEAGFAELEVVVTSPLGRHLPLEVKGDGVREADRIEFTPSLPGRYKFDITFAGENVQGSPVTFIVEEEGGPRVQGPGLILAQVATIAMFRLDGRGIPGQPHVQVDGLENSVICELEEDGEEGLWIARYTPQEAGVFDIRVFWNGREIAGSPFHPRVVAPNKVRIIGGIESITDRKGCIPMILGQELKITLDVGEAGPGHLQADLDGPSSSGNSDGPMCCSESQTPSRVRLSLLATRPGPHQLQLTWADFPIPGSPFPIHAVQPDIHTQTGEGRVVLSGKGLAHARCGEESLFTIDGSAAGPGTPEVHLCGPKGEDVTSVQLQVESNNVFQATYIPELSGTHLLTVKWAGRQVKGCPLAVAVTGGADASRVVCAGDGLRVATVGKEARSFIDTRRAGPGELTAQCHGPRRPAYCELYDHGDGTFTLSLRAQEAGRHALAIKYGGENVPGSPFPLRVLGAPDASKVRVYGPGIDHGVLATFQSRFVCDTRGAGAGQLTVRIRGPKGAFRVEMQRESQKDRAILCKYDPTEPGDYRVEIKWAGDHVPGSPFLIMIFDTQEELARFIQGDYSPPAGNGLMPADIYGTNGYVPAGAIPLGQMSWRGSQAQL